MNIAIVGATGMVGRTFIKVLQERGLKADNFYLYASGKSAGKTIKIYDKEYVVLELAKENIVGKAIDYAFFSAGGEVSKIFAPIFVEEGSIVIDNSSQWRMNPSVPLVVPEVNSEDILWNRGIIANPNCSTIQAMPPLKALLDKYGLKRVVFSTYQAVSGAGQRGYDDLERGINGEPPQKFPYPIFSNVIPHIDVFFNNGYTKEEMKMIEETRKILHENDLKVTATTVRVPVYNAHSESVNVELQSAFDLDELKSTLANFDGIKILDDTSNNVYPMPINVSGKDEVYVGRIRRDYSLDNGVNMWIVADNIRKGAATNALQILEKLMQYKAEVKL